jgi:hypothetical protein
VLIATSNLWIAKIVRSGSVDHQEFTCYIKHLVFRGEGMFEISDTEAMLLRQRNGILSEANSTIALQNAEIAALRRAVLRTRRDLETVRTENTALKVQLTRLSRRH